jgi:hypothetical protein
MPVPLPITPTSGTHVSYHRGVDEPLALLLPLNIHEANPEDVPTRRQAVIEAAAEAFGTELSVDAREINVGRGGDAGALLLEIAGAVGIATGLVLGPAELVRKVREGVNEYRRWARKAKQFVDRLAAQGHKPTILSPALALPVLWTELESRIGPIYRLVWWDEIVIQPFEWVEDPTSFEATAERVYFYVFETSHSRWFLATKGDGTIVTEVETMVPDDYIEYDLWQRDTEAGASDSP